MFALARRHPEPGCLTGVEAVGGAMVRAEALAALVSTARYCFEPPQLNAIR